MRRVLAAALCLLVLISCLPGTVRAKKEVTEDKHDIAWTETRRSYTRSLRTAKKTSFSGYCGMLASHQLWHMDINSWCASYNGKDQYDAYCTEEVTSGGYYIRPYSAIDYSLEEALNAISQNGTKDVKNILVGFQRTKSEAGKKYGHAMVINSILDGTVYFVESSRTGFGLEGQVITCTISEFAEYYDRSMTFEGIIHFGKEYADICNTQGTDLFLQARFDSVLRSQPTLVGQKDCSLYRDIAAGERFHATAVFTDPQGEVYYQVQEGETVGYIAASAVGVLQLNSEALEAMQVALPKSLETGNDMRLTGLVRGESAQVSALEAAVTDVDGNIVLREWLDVQDTSADLSKLNENLAFDLLTEGSYLVTIYADAACTVVGPAGLEVRYQRQQLWSQALQVGGAGEESVEVSAQPQTREGWFYEGGSWYCYENGAPCTGWVTRLGIAYYLDETGKALTGVNEVEGKTLYFSATGALCTGWLTTDAGVSYRREDGTAVAGWLETEGGRYYFDETGILVTDTELADGETVYVLGPDGRATEKTEEE